MEFRGLHPAITTPMVSGGKLNEAAFRKVMEFNIHAGEHGFWVAGGTGQSILLDDKVNPALKNMSLKTYLADCG